MEAQQKAPRPPTPDGPVGTLLTAPLHTTCRAARLAAIAGPRARPAGRSPAHDTHTHMCNVHRRRTRAVRAPGGRLCHTDDMAAWPPTKNVKCTDTDASPHTDDTHGHGHMSGQARPRTDTARTNRHIFTKVHMHNHAWGRTPTSNSGLMRRSTLNTPWGAVVRCEPDHITRIVSANSA